MQDARESNSFHTCDSFNTYKYHNGFSVAFVRVIVNYIHSCGNCMFKSCMYRGQWYVQRSTVCMWVNGMYAGMYGGQRYAPMNGFCTVAHAATVKSG